MLRTSRRKCEASLTEFIQQAWHVIEPANPYVYGWHIGAIGMHLDAIEDGDINRLLINIPPGHMKSLLVSVFWPAYLWGPRNQPNLRFLCASHSQSLAIRDSTKMRRLITSKWYQDRWGDRVQLTGDQNAKTKFENTATGFREAVAAGSITGSRGDIVIIDDPHSVEGANSDAMRESTIEWFLEAVPTRLNNPESSSIVVIMQRLSEGDVSGVILDKQLGYEHLCLPMEFEEDRRCETSIGFVDPRDEEGELLFEARFPREVVERDKRVMGPYACNPYEAPILMSDLTMKPIGEIKVGDEIVGFDKKIRKDGVKGKFKLTKTSVLEVHSRTAPVVKMTLETGEVIRCTPDHKWFKKDRGDNREMYSPVKVGGKVARICPAKLPVLTREEERLAGWIAGFFDGEGSVTNSEKRNDPSGDYRPSSTINFYQGAGRNLPLCQKLEMALDNFGFNYVYSEDERKPNKDAPCYGYRNYRLRSESTSLNLMQKFLHIVQPVKWKQRIIDGAYGSKFISGRERVISIEPDGEETVYALTTTTGNYVVWGLASSNSAGQFQQRPSPRGGGIIQRSWWQLYDDDEAAAQGLNSGNSYPDMEYVIASLDTAYTEKQENDASYLTIWGIWQRGGSSARAILTNKGERIDLIDDRDTIPCAMLMHAKEMRLHIHGSECLKRPGETDYDFRKRERESWGLVEWTIHMCNQFKVDMLLVESKASGLSVAQEIKRLNRNNNWTVQLVNPGSADKVARAYAVQASFSNGQIWAPDRDWADKVITQCEVFPKGKHDDAVDSTTQAIGYMRERGLLNRQEDVLAGVSARSAYKKPTRPIYDT